MTEFLDIVKTVGFPSAVLMAVGVALWSILKAFVASHIKHVEAIQEALQQQTGLMANIVAQQQLLNANASKQSELLQEMSKEMGILGVTYDRDMRAKKVVER